ncbi:MAG: VOC family protein [Actinobacteria bacterium]|nr:VOC family protein [Actinomycetota bacterium]
MFPPPRLDHVGITVTDLDAAIAFFVDLGLGEGGRMILEGDFLDTVIATAGAQVEIAMVTTPGGGPTLELSRFIRPPHVPASPAPPENEPGLRNVTLEVEDVHAAVDRAAARGYGLIGGVGDYEGEWRMAHLRGPDGIIVSVAQRLR